MGTWIEIRCEKRGEPFADGVGLHAGERCYSHVNSGPMDMAEDTQAGVLVTLRKLDKKARSEGWLKTRDGWVCPYCQKAPD